LGKTHIVSDKGLSYLQSEIERLNKKAIKWGVSPMEVHIKKEEFVTKSITVDFATGKQVRPDPNNPSQEQRDVILKQYEVELIGNPPRVDGYEFIAKIEHTPEGNILNYAPKSSDKSLPTEYRTGTQKCDICNTSRDRNNTFVLKLEKDDPQRFSNKRAGDFIMVGSSCLKRFLPGTTAASLMEYAQYIEELRSLLSSVDDIDDSADGGGGGGGAGQTYLEQDRVAFWLSAVYLHDGKYISKTAAEKYSSTSTLDLVKQCLYPGRKDPVYSKRYKEDESFKKSVDELSAEFLAWMPTKNFEESANSNPTYAEFFRNLSVLSKQKTFRYSNSGLFAAMFQVFLRDKGDLEKKRQQALDKGHYTLIGQIGEKTKAKVKVTKLKEYEGAYGRGLIVNLTGHSNEKDLQSGQNVEKTGDLVYFTGDGFELEVDEEAEVEFTVKAHDPKNKYTGFPSTTITRMKVLNFITNPDRNKGKEKLKEMTGTVKINGVMNSHDYRTQSEIYTLTFAYDKTVHPDMVSFGSSWAINFSITLPDKNVFETYLPYDKKTVEAKWTLSRATTLDKLKSGGSAEAVKFQILKLIGSDASA
jgi:hypothetical protein